MITVVEIKTTNNSSDIVRRYKPLEELIYNEKLKDQEKRMEPGFSCNVYFSNNVYCGFDMLAKNKWLSREFTIRKNHDIFIGENEDHEGTLYAADVPNQK